MTANCADVVEKGEFLSCWVEFLRNRSSSNSRGIGPCDSFDYVRDDCSVIIVQYVMKLMLRLNLFGHFSYFFNIVEPSKPRLQVVITTIHHLDIFFSHLINHIEL